jgi:hypothetical protein
MKQHPLPPEGAVYCIKLSNGKYGLLYCCHAKKVLKSDIHNFDDELCKHYFYLVAFDFYSDKKITSIEELENIEFKILFNTRRDDSSYGSLKSGPSAHQENAQYFEYFQPDEEYKPHFIGVIKLNYDVEEMLFKNKDTLYSFGSPRSDLEEEYEYRNNKKLFLEKRADELKKNDEEREKRHNEYLSTLRSTDPKIKLRKENVNKLLKKVEEELFYEIENAAVQNEVLKKFEDITLSFTQELKSSIENITEDFLEKKAEEYITNISALDKEYGEWIHTVGREDIYTFVFEIMYILGYRKEVTELFKNESWFI